MATKHGRRFGVEIECGTNGHGINGAQRLLRNNGFAEWGRAIGYDGTEVEIRSPILEGPDGFKELKDVMELLSENSYYVTYRDGMHVHHEAPEFVENVPGIIKLVKSWHENQSVIDNLVKENRRTNAYCPKWTTEELKHLESLSEYRRVARYKYNRGTLNTTSLLKHGTIEIRQHEGTLDFEVAEAWIKFGQSFLDSVLKRKRPLKNVKTVEVLLSRVNAPKKTNAVLLKKAGVK